MSRRPRTRIGAWALVLTLLASGLPDATDTTAEASTPAAGCTGSTGPGIPAPASVPAGLPGFHAAWYGQSGYPTLCPGERSTAVIAYYNSGSLGWTRGKMGEVAYLGTWGPEPGQDQPSELGGNGARGSPSTGWPEHNRIALQPAAWVGPGQVAWFTFTIQAPLTPGTYRLGLRPLIEGATWLEDYGVFWVVTVLNPDGTPPPPPPAVYTPLGYSRVDVPTAAGMFSAHIVKERLAAVTVKTLTGAASDCADDCPAKPLAEYIRENGGFAGMNSTYICPPDYAECAGKTNTFDYAVYNSNLGRWIGAQHLISNSLATFTTTAGGTTARFYPRSSQYDRSAVTAGISMFPIMLLGGQLVDTTASQTEKQRQRNTKGAIGADGSHIYLVIVSGASMNEAAYVMQAIGARDAMNLDGGGTSALYTDGTYRVGPGRLLPNAIVLVRR